MSGPEAAEEWVWLARIRRPQGRKGEVFAEILTDFPEKFAQRKRLWLLSPQAASAATDAARGPRLPDAGPSKGNSVAGARSGAPSSSLLGTGEAKSALPQARPAVLAAHWPHKGGVVLHFADVDSISAAEMLAGLIVAIPRAERASLGEDEAYIGDLIGCTLIDVAGAQPVPVGEIEGVDRTAGPVALLVVRGAAGEVLIPFAKSYLRRIDLQARRIEMALPEGLIDLNAMGGG